MSAERALRSIPEIGLEFPSDTLVSAAFAYAEKYCSEGVNNHVARCAYWAIILSKKLPKHSLTTSKAHNSRPVDIEEVVLTCLLHDLGMATWMLESSDPQDASSNPLPGLLSLDKRFEVDCANIARDFVQKETQGNKEERTALASNWDDARLDRLWTAIALHASPSFARHVPAPEIALVHQAIEADFFGPYWSPTCTQPPPSPGQAPPEFKPVITVEEYRTVTKLFPRLDFDRDGVVKTLCTLCRRKPDTTYDNLVGLVGKEYLTDDASEQGIGKTEFRAQWKMRQSPAFLLTTLDKLAAIDNETK